MTMRQQLAILMTLRVAAVGMAPWGSLSPANTSTRRLLVACVGTGGPSAAAIESAGRKLGARLSSLGAVWPSPREWGRVRSQEVLPHPEGHGRAREPVHGIER